MPEIVLTHVTKRWDKFYAVDDLNLVIDDNAFVTLLGPSGCGKTTTLRMIAGLETPTSGRITIGGRVVYDSEAGINIPPNKRKVGFLFQNYALWPNMTVYQNISFGLSNIKEELPKFDPDASRAATLLRVLQKPDDVVKTIVECVDKKGKLDVNKAQIKLIDRYEISIYAAKTLMSYKLHESMEPGTVAQARRPELEAALKSARDKAAAAGCTLNDRFEYEKDGKPVTAHDLKAEGAMTALLKDALKPNLVQTLEGTPTLIHGGPFANIAHGCNSVTATRMALKLGDYVVTEAGFGADLGAEKFLDIKCRLAGLRPNAVVIVATVRALKSHGGVPKAELNTENLDALEKGLPNLLHHVNTIRSTYHLPCVVAINAFPTDTEAELRLVEEKCRELGVRAVLSEVWAKGGEGGKALAEEVVRLCEQPSAEAFTFSYPTDTTLVNKLNAIVQRVYGGAQAVLTPAAQKQAERLTELGFGDLPVCMAKTQYSLSDDPTLLGAPKDFSVTVRSLKVSAGAGFIVALTGEIMTMPGLPKVPAAEKIDVDENGRITGLF